MRFFGSIKGRISSFVELNADTGCWEWTGSLNNGYGVVTVDGTPRLAHRVSYEEYVGPIPDGLHIDHLCRNTRCCNPQHLEPVTQAENNRRSRPYRFKTHCKRGHALVDGNLYYRKNGTRTCRQCAIEWKREHRK